MLPACDKTSALSVQFKKKELVYLVVTPLNIRILPAPHNAWRWSTYEKHKAQETNGAGSLKLILVEYIP